MIICNACGFGHLEHEEVMACYARHKPAEPKSEVPAPLHSVIPDALTKEERMRERERISPTPRVEEVEAPEEIWTVEVHYDSGPQLEVFSSFENAQWVHESESRSFPPVRYVRAREGR